MHVSPGGIVLEESAWLARRDEFLASSEDLDYVLSLMKPVRQAGDYAGWISPPKSGVGGKPGEFEYVRIAA